MGQRYYSDSENERIRALRVRPPHAQEQFAALAAELGRSQKAVESRWYLLRQRRELLAQEQLVKPKHEECHDAAALIDLLDRVGALEPAVAKLVQLVTPGEPPPVDPLDRYR